MPGQAGSWRLRPPDRGRRTGGGADRLGRAVPARHPELANVLAGRTTQDEALDELAQDRAQLEELAAAYADRAITMRKWLAARQPFAQRVTSSGRRLTPRR